MAEGTYHSTAEVISKFKKLSVGAATPITTSEMQEEMGRTEAYIYGKIDPFYDMTLITDADTPKSWQIVKMICVYYTAGVIKEILRKNGIEAPLADETDKAQTMIQRAEKLLTGIAMFVTKGNVIGAVSLPDATARALSTKSAATGQGDSTPEFKKDKIQW